MDVLPGGGGTATSELAVLVVTRALLVLPLEQDGAAAAAATTRWARPSGGGRAVGADDMPMMANCSYDTLGLRDAFKTCSAAAKRTPTPTRLTTHAASPHSRPIPYIAMPL